MRGNRLNAANNEIVALKGAVAGLQTAVDERAKPQATEPEAK